MLAPHAPTAMRSLSVR